MIQMAPENGRISHRKPHYDGEDTSPTTTHELLGWYSYGIAAEVFAVCGVGENYVSSLLLTWSHNS